MTDNDMTADASATTSEITTFFTKRIDGEVYISEDYDRDLADLDLVVFVRVQGSADGVWMRDIWSAKVSPESRKRITAGEVDGESLPLSLTVHVSGALLIGTPDQSKIHKGYAPGRWTSFDDLPLSIKPPQSTPETEGGINSN